MGIPAAATSLRLGGGRVSLVVQQFELPGTRPRDSCRSFVRLGRDVLARDLYALLGVSPGASAARIREAYRREVRRSHPDLHARTPSPGEERTVELNLAAFVLLDAERRAAYDRARSAPAPRTAFTPYECVWAEAATWPSASAAELALDPDVVRLLPLLRTPIGAAAERFRVWTNALSPQTAITITMLCVALFMSVVGVVRPSSLTKLIDDGPERTALDSVSRHR
jgi:hypothetical protein